jgi:hypothetical protein
MDQTTKECSRCRETKSLLEFYKRKRNPSGHESMCKICIGVMAKKSRDINKGYIAKRASDYYNKNKDRINKKTMSIFIQKSQNLEDSYIVGLLHKKYGVSRDQIKENSHIIDITRNLLKIKREIYDKKQ